MVRHVRHIRRWRDGGGGGIGTGAQHVLEPGSKTLVRVADAISALAEPHAEGLEQGLHLSLDREQRGGRVPRWDVPQWLQVASVHDVVPRILYLPDGAGRSLSDDAGPAYLRFPASVAVLANCRTTHGRPAEGTAAGPEVAHTHLRGFCVCPRPHCVSLLSCMVCTPSVAML